MDRKSPEKEQADKEGEPMSDGGEKRIIGRGVGKQILRLYDMIEQQNSGHGAECADTAYPQYFQKKNE